MERGATRRWGSLNDTRSLVVQGGTGVVSCVGGTCPPSDVMGRAHHPCGLPLPNPEPGLTIKKTSSKSQLRTF